MHVGLTYDVASVQPTMSSERRVVEQRVHEGGEVAEVVDGEGRLGSIHRVALTDLIANTIRQSLYG